MERWRADLNVVGDGEGEGEGEEEGAGMGEEGSEGGGEVAGVVGDAFEFARKEKGGGQALAEVRGDGHGWWW